MADPRRRPGGLTPWELAEHYARCFVGQRCVLGPTLVVPFEVLFASYQDWCRTELEAWVPSRRELRDLLDAAPWAEAVDRPRARGALKTIVRGVGCAPVAPVHARPGQ